MQAQEKWKMRPLKDEPPCRGGRATYDGATDGSGDNRAMRMLTKSFSSVSVRCVDALLIFC
jgi:hypothetical protein